MNYSVEYSPLLKDGNPTDTTRNENQVSLQASDQKSAQKSAKEFEAAFIAQMLQYSGLADALTSSGGEDLQSFSQFYLEALAEKISENGGFGIAKSIYTHIQNKRGSNDELGQL